MTDKGRRSKGEGRGSGKCHNPARLPRSAFASPEAPSGASGGCLGRKPVESADPIPSFRFESRFIGTIEPSVRALQSPLSGAPEKKGQEEIAPPHTPTGLRPRLKPNARCAGLEDHAESPRFRFGVGFGFRISGLRTIAAALLAIAAFASTGRAETVVANDGKSCTGTVTVGPHDLVCENPAMRWTLAITTIRDIELSGDEQIEFDRRAKRLQPLDAGAIADLGLWLKSKHQHALAQEHFTKALGVDPNCAVARRELGFERKGDAWVYSPVLHQKMMYDWVGRKAAAFHFDLAKKLHAMGNQPAIEEKELRRVLQADAVRIEAIDMLRPLIAHVALKNKYRLPVAGRWAAVSGATVGSGHGGYSYMMNAFDFRRIDEQGRFYSGPPTELKSYYTFEQPIYAMADGEVYDMHAEYPDNPIGVSASIEEGNRIGLRHAGGEYSIVGHLQKGSFKVKVGDKVKQGQILAILGNSGRSSSPHLHFAIFDGDGVSLPMTFQDFDVVEKDGKRHVDSGTLEEGRIYENRFDAAKAK